MDLVRDRLDHHREVARDLLLKREADLLNLGAGGQDDGNGDLDLPFLRKDDRDGASDLKRMLLVLRQRGPIDRADALAYDRADRLPGDAQLAVGGVVVYFQIVGHRLILPHRGSSSRRFGW